MLQDKYHVCSNAFQTVKQLLWLRRLYATFQMLLSAFSYWFLSSFAGQNVGSAAHPQDRGRQQLRGVNPGGDGS